jgi:3-methylfumaryl-CoA hydratase
MSGAFDAWIGRTEEAVDTITSRQARQMAATLGDTWARCALDDGSVLPNLWHWMGWSPDAAMAGLGPDGHPAKGAFLPPVPLERRMWAGGRLTFHSALRIGEPMKRRSEILKVSEKTGSAGTMVFVTVGHETHGPDGLAVTEEQDIVYVAMPTAFTPPPAIASPDAAAWVESPVMDTVRLFRFSALTFNAHRIHFDLPYAMDVEKYPGLIVHGPLQAMLLMEGARRHNANATPTSFRFRGVRPLFHFNTVRLLAQDPVDGAQALCTATEEGVVCMQADISWKATA